MKKADLWLDSVTSLPPASANYQVWSRKEWIENTLEQWKNLFEPVATNYSNAIANNLIGDENSNDPNSKAHDFFLQKITISYLTLQILNLMKNQNGIMFSGSPKDMMNKMFSTLFGFKVGGAFANIAKNVFGSNDIGIQLTKVPTTALVGKISKNTPLN